MQWTQLNNLLLNVTKTKAIVIGSYYYIDNLSRNSIKGVLRNSTLINFESTVKSLDVTLDCKLNLKKNISFSCRKSNSLMYRLNFFQRSTTLELRKHLVETLLFPLVDYCSLVIWGLSDELDLKIQRIINFDIR